MDEGIGMGERRWVVIGFPFSCVEEEGEEGGGNSSFISMLKSDEASSSLVEGKIVPVIICSPFFATRTGSVMVPRDCGLK